MVLLSFSLFLTPLLNLSGKQGLCCGFLLFEVDDVLVAFGLRLSRHVKCLLRS